MPPYYSKAMPANPKKIMDEHVEETTRRIGGRGAAPAMVAPSMGAMPMPFTPAMQMPTGFGASISTAPIKAQTMSIAPSSSKFSWKLSQVPTLPEFHPLERTAVFVPNTTPAMVAPRISDVLRERSIQAFYDDDKAKVKCITTEGVDFRIRLYRGRNQYSHGIIVEVQRRFGFSIHFHSDTQAILDAAQGKIPTPPPMQPNALPEVSDDEDDEDFDMTPSGSASLQMVEKMLSLPGFDAQYLGLQTLSSLVDSEKMTLQTARRVSAALLKPDSKVGQQVFGYITKRNFEESYMSLRVLCLGILANAMRASSIVPEFLRGALRPVLLDDLREAEKFPNAALVAARCMEYFIRGDHDSVELNEAFQIAREVGEARHTSLMQQADRCIASIR